MALNASRKLSTRGGGQSNQNNTKKKVHRDGEKNALVPKAHLYGFQTGSEIK